VTSDDGSRGAAPTGRGLSDDERPATSMFVGVLLVEVVVLLALWALGRYFA
jgi:F0F1-type ATP synthase membrane subunit c/vacuolar-type H+-ATPase subunit K